MSVVEDAYYVASKSQTVSVDESSIKDLSKIIFNSAKNFSENVAFPSRLFLNEMVFAETIFVFSCVNFCFWGDPDWQITTKDGLVLRRTEAMEECVYQWSIGKLTASEIIGSLSYAGYLNSLQGGVNLQFLDDRWLYLQEAKSVLDKKYNGSFFNLLKSANFDALLLLDLLVKEFTFFNDTSTYNGKRILFYKKTQALISSIGKVIKSNPLTNLDKLTAFADYRLPQILNKHGVLRYSDSLTNKISNLIPIENGSNEEVELRACSIYAIELLKENLKSMGLRNIKSSEIDEYLWITSRSSSFGYNPHHRTSSTYY